MIAHQYTRPPDSDLVFFVNVDKGWSLDIEHTEAENTISNY